ncbi:WXG100 family type VII secretion target [Streptomyces sp. SL13]|jgi:WXG100 family type VII secretion target|uniref:WXG100 family type VII secretion target n=1 Tax=Streptantibioticus silvisoli TaxID=2705255 RepID=A0AA90KIQ5_9ACTN|nr:WXG100 family type VII secretion target [Streptantibioticus silvisoli]MDI5965333.1 WXG100 family type VII secretion target [Streptantibioticus silvisoli]MDI5972884.1 WXG100 family type VII secretion target [Streptantibioticus silvisoli]
MSSGSTVNVQWESLSQLENDINEKVSMLDGQIKRLNGIVDSVKASWSGQGASAYQALQMQVNEDARRLKEVLSAIHEAVHLAKGGFSAADEEQMSKFKGLNGTTADNSILDRLS